jgi:hypothetical protein
VQILLQLVGTPGFQLAHVMRQGRIPDIIRLLLPKAHAVGQPIEALQ